MVDQSSAALLHCTHEWPHREFSDVADVYFRLAIQQGSVQENRRTSRIRMVVSYVCF